MQLSVKLRDGFKNNAVSIRVDGTEVYNKSAVTTDLTISFADKVEVPVQKGSVTLEVSVAGVPSSSVEVRTADTPFVEVTIVDGKVDLRSFKNEIPMM